jgi:hypothetical protein
MRHATTRGARASARRTAADFREALRLTAIQRNPRSVVENILSRAMLVAEVSRRMLSHPGDTDAAIEHVAARWGVSVEIVRECMSIEALESGQ